MNQDAQSTKSCTSILQQSQAVMRLMEQIKSWKNLGTITDPVHAPERKETSSHIRLQPAEMEIVLAEVFRAGKSLIPGRDEIQRKRFSMHTCREALQDTFNEKVYLERFLATEKKRLAYLVSRPRRNIKDLPFTRIWMELITAGFAKTSSIMQRLSADELCHIDDLLVTSVQMNMWHRLQVLTAKGLLNTRSTKQNVNRARFLSTSNLLKTFWQMYIRSQFREAASQAVVTLQMVEQWRDKRPDSVKWQFEADLCHLIGLCLDGLKRHRAALVFFQMDARLAEFANIMLAKKRALDNIGRMYAILGKYKEALACWTQRLKTNVEGEELAWLLYQIALCNMLMDDYKEAIRHCRGCIKAAESSECFHWALSGNLLLATAAALIACRSQNDTRMIQTSMLCLEQAYNFALRINRVCVINAVLEIIRNVYNLVGDDQDENLILHCWSSSLLDLLKQESTHGAQSNTKVLRELLLYSGKKLG